MCLVVSVKGCCCPTKSFATGTEGKCVVLAAAAVGAHGVGRGHSREAICIQLQSEVIRPLHPNRLQNVTLMALLE